MHRYVHTYIIDHYNPSVVLDLTSHTTYVVCVNLNMSVTAYSFRTTDFWKIFHDNFYLHSEFLPEIR